MENFKFKKIKIFFFIKFVKNNKIYSDMSTRTCPSNFRQKLAKLAKTRTNQI